MLPACVVENQSMSDRYRIFGMELSPFSVKVRSYYRYKQIPHEWIVRNADSMSDYQKYAKIPIVPLPRQNPRTDHGYWCTEAYKETSGDSNPESLMPPDTTRHNRCTGNHPCHAPAAPGRQYRPGGCP